MIHFNLSLAMFLIASTAAIGQTSFWPNSATPGLRQVTSTASATLGLKFYSTVPGSVTGARFYKGSRNTGTHVGTLWASTGAKLASVTFSGESASGWQQATFSSPINIAANTTYVISYTAPYGAHAHDQYYGWSTLNAGSLRVAGSSPAVFTYASGVQFPTSTWNNSNYWVDVTFSPTSTAPPPNPGPSTYTISGNVRGSSATITLSGAASRTTSTDGLGNFSFTGLSKGSYIVAPTRPGYTFSPATAVLTVNTTSITGVTFTGAAIPAPVPHSVVLSWNASTSSNLKGYHVYRAVIAGGAFTKMTASPVAATAYTDGAVTSGRIYYYVTSAVDSNNVESGYSNQVTAVIPTP